jgi:hypothetical protein
MVLYDFTDLDLLPSSKKRFAFLNVYVHVGIGLAFEGEES